MNQRTQKMNRTNFSKPVFEISFKRALYNLTDYSMAPNTQIKSETLLFEDLNLNEVDIVEILMRLDFKYNIHMPYNPKKRYRTVGAIGKAFYAELAKQTKKQSR